MSDRFPYSLILCAMLLPGDALAGRPMITDDAAVLDATDCQVELSAGSGPTQRWAMPSCGLGHHWEAGLGVGETHAPGARNDAWAYGIKKVFAPLTANSVGIGATVAEQRTTGPGSPRDRMLNLLASVPVGEGATVHFNAGAVRHGSMRRTAATWAAALESRHGRAGLSVEVLGERGASRTWQVGASWVLVPGVLDLDAGAGRVHDADGRHAVVAVGLTYIAGHW